jgi:hypothetical protein
MIIIPSLTADVASLSLAIDQKNSFPASPSLKKTHHSFQNLLIFCVYNAQIGSALHAGLLDCNCDQGRNLT